MDNEENKRRSRQQQRQRRRRRGQQSRQGQQPIRKQRHEGKNDDTNNDKEHHCWLLLLLIPTPSSWKTTTTLRFGGLIVVLGCVVFHRMVSHSLLDDQHSHDAILFNNAHSHQRTTDFQEYKGRRGSGRINTRRHQQDEDIPVVPLENSGFLPRYDFTPWTDDLLLDTGGNKKTDEAVIRKEAQNILDHFQHRYGSGDRRRPSEGRKTTTTSATTASAASSYTDPAPPLQQQELLRQGLLSGSPHGLARKVLLRNSKKGTKKKSFTIGIMGSTAAAGYGNASYRNSYGYVLRELLKPLFDAMQHLPLKVENYAIRESTEFPQLWCSNNVLDNNDRTLLPDLLVYDYGEELSEPHPTRLEAFLRYIVAASGNKKPLVVFRGTRSLQHKQLLETYRPFVDIVVLQDAATLSKPPSSSFVPANDWKRFDNGSNNPDSLHGHNLSIQQHNWTAWILAVHFAAASKLSSTLIVDDEDEESHTTTLPEPRFLTNGDHRGAMDQQQQQQPPLKAWETPLLLEPHPERIHCRSTFTHMTLVQDTQSNANGLRRRQDGRSKRGVEDLLDWSEWIVGGLSSAEPESALEDLLLPKITSYRRKGWVLDIDPDYRRHKQLLLKSSGGEDFGGFRDWKMALYGTPHSGPLQLFVPLSDQKQDKDRDVTDLLETLLICESDTATIKKQNDDSSCRLSHDVQITVAAESKKDNDHQTATTARIEPATSPAISTLDGKHPCIHVRMPTNHNIRTVAHRSRWSSSSPKTESYGLLLNITVTTNNNLEITTRKQNGPPCSVAHVIWSTKR